MLNRITPELVADSLRDDIATGRLSPGAALRQEDLAERFGVSRIPVREALRQLESEGVVIVQANRGAFVRSFTPEELREIYDLRVLLETDVLRRSIPKMTEADLVHIRNLIRAQQNAGKTQLRELDRSFHHALYEAAGRPLQVAMIMRLRDSIAHYAPAESHMRRLKSDWMDDHVQIADACKRKDARVAVRILTRHLKVAAEITLGNLDRDPFRADGRGGRL